MIDYTFSGVKVALTRKIKKSDLGKAQPVYWRVTFKRKQVYYYTGLKYHDSEWDDFINRKLQKHKETKVDIKVYFENNIKPIIKDLVLNSSFSFEAFEAMLYNQNSNSTVNNAFENKITSLEENNKIGNASIYISTLKALMRFKHYSLIKRKVDKQKFIETCIEKKHITTGKDILVVEEEISFDEITPKFLNECEKFWEATEVSFATMGIYMRTLRAIINNKDGDKPFLEGDKYPFGINGKKYEIPEGGRRDIAMPIDDIWKIENFKTDNEALSVARDME